MTNKTPTGVERAMESNWRHVDYRFSLKAEDMFAVDSKQIPVVVFTNIKTGEIKIFNRSMVEKIGIDNIKL